MGLAAKGGEGGVNGSRRGTRGCVARQRVACSSVKEKWCEGHGLEKENGKKDRAWACPLHIIFFLLKLIIAHLFLK